MGGVGASGCGAIAPGPPGSDGRVGAKLQAETPNIKRMLSDGKMRNAASSL